MYPGKHLLCLYFQYEPNQTTYIVHLVCSQVTGDASLNFDSIPNVTRNTETENELRHRNWHNSNGNSDDNNPATITSEYPAADARQHSYG